MSNQLTNDYNNGLISYQDYLVNTALSIYAPEKLPDRYGIEEIAGHRKSGTMIAAQIKSHWNELNSEQQSVLKTFISRPELTYNAVSPSGQFRVHYEKSGYSSVSPVDVNPANDIPDFVDAVMESFDQSHHYQTTVLRFESPPTDNGAGGGDEFDIYIKNFSRIYGQTVFEKTLPGDTNRYISYIEIDNNYYGFPTSGLDGMRVTSAHEYFHAIQMGYKFLPDDDPFWEDEVFYYEISSTWMEDMVYDEINDYYFYLDNFFNFINKPFDTYDGSYEYGNCLWNHMLTQKYGASIVKEIWNEIVNYPVLEAIERALVKYNTTFLDELIDYSIWNYHTGSRADTINYYEEGASYYEAKPERNLTFKADTSINEQSAQLSYSYYHVYDPETSVSTVLIPINLEDNIGVLSDFTLELSRLNSYLFTSITDNLKARLIVENRYDWLGQAVVSNDTEQNSLISFSAVDPWMIESDDIILNLGPNPFKPGIDEALNISYQVDSAGPVTIAIFREDGTRVRTVEIDDARSGINSFTWRIAEIGDFPGGSGIYLLIIQTKDEKQVVKFAVIR
ncbi:hypothetical protein JXB12_04155 [candidate division KSB1 bacterium]|nr:hypothetical protein [candidate division KSB1 bacterium]